MPKVSVIIPAYNAGRFLSECLESILRQTFLDYEVIVCDDGSGDETIDILKGYASKDRRFSYLQLDHGGAGNARNVGIDAAKGGYLYFLDADDMIEPDALQKLYEAAYRHKADVVIAKSHYLDDITGAISPIDFTVVDVPFYQALSGDELPLRPFQSFVGWPWDKLFRAEFIRQKGLRYQTLRSSNDAFFVYLALCMSSRVVCLEDDLFTHRTNNAGSLERTRSKSWNNAVIAMNSIGETLRTHDELERYWDSYVNWVSHFSYWSMATLDGDGLNDEVASAFFKVLSSVSSDDVTFYKQEDADFADLAFSSRMEVIVQYIKLRRENEKLVTRLYSEEHDLMEKIEQQQAFNKELSGRISSIEKSRSYKFSQQISRSYHAIKRLMKKETA